MTVLVTLQEIVQYFMKPLHQPQVQINRKEIQEIV